MWSCACRTLALASGVRTKNKKGRRWRRALAHLLLLILLRWLSSDCCVAAVAVKGAQRASDVRGEVKAATIHRKSCRVVEESSFCLTSTLVCCGCCLRGDAASVEVQLQSRACTGTCMRAHRRTSRHATTVTTDGCALMARLEREEGSDDCV